jgi:hypothetical protein
VISTARSGLPNSAARSRNALASETVSVLSSTTPRGVSTGYAFTGIADAT